jgi:putative redox protein
MATSTIKYPGNLRTIMTHLQSGNEVITDAPTDNHGKGEAFSPTDLVATGLGSCMLTVMGIKADSLGISMEGAELSITKHMGTAPRRIVQIDVEVVLPASINVEHRSILEITGKSCPVAKSLHPDLIQNITFQYR